MENDNILRNEIGELINRTDDQYELLTQIVFNYKLALIAFNGGLIALVLNTRKDINYNYFGIKLLLVSILYEIIIFIYFYIIKSINLNNRSFYLRKLSLINTETDLISKALKDGETPELKERVRFLKEKTSGLAAEVGTKTNFKDVYTNFKKGSVLKIFFRILFFDFLPTLLMLVGSFIVFHNILSVFKN